MEAMRAVLEAGTARRVMLMSGEFRSTGLTMDDLYRSGAAAFLERPFGVNKLFGLLDRWSEEKDGEGKPAQNGQTGSASKTS
jgi:DNA-binding NtrC family response regulator